MARKVTKGLTEKEPREHVRLVDFEKFAAIYL